MPIPRLEEWRAQALTGLEQALQMRETSEPAQQKLDEANRRIGEQIIQGHTYRNCDELATALAAFPELYNREWRLEKLRYKSPIEARRDYQKSFLLAA